MELTDDLVAVQGILISVIKSTGEFTKINFKGGNEEKILMIMEQIQKHIKRKNYIKDGKINSSFDSQLEDIVLFLAINTKYKKALELEDYDHLINIMPQLSKCLLANIVYGLDLGKYYCKVIEKLPLIYGIELLEEMIPCLKKSLPEIQLRYAIMLLRATAIKLSSDKISGKDEDNVYKLAEVTNIILQYLTGIYPGHVKNLRAIKIYQHMGFTLLSLFELLLYCGNDRNNIYMKKFIENVVNTCCTIIKNVTINVFCSWAEITEGDEPLQNVVAGKAYLIVEEYQKYKEAKELIGMLGAIAKKPKTLSERIQTADIEVIIKKVHVKDADQKAWFEALLATQIFNSNDAMNCVDTWAHLCDKNDVTRLLHLSCQSENEVAKNLTLKCASTLILEELILIMTRYFYENKFSGLLPGSENVESHLKSIFNKMNGQMDVDKNFIKDVCLLMLQSPSTVLKSIYSECLRNQCYTKYYKKLFVSVKNMMNINDFGVGILSQVISNVQPNSDNVDNYVALLLMLQEIDYLTNSNIINSLLLPLLDLFRHEKRFEHLGYVLQIFLGCSIKIPATSEMTNVRWAVLNAMNDCRCTFLELHVIKHHTASYAVDVINSLCEVHPDYNFEEQSPASSSTSKNFDEFTNYYIKYLSCKTDTTLLRTLYHDFNIEIYTLCVSRVLWFLPRAVTNEWTNILQEIFFLCGSEKAMELLTDVMILLCEVVQTQDPNSNTGRQVTVALKYCLQQYGIALQNIQMDSTGEVEVDISKNVCRLLKHLPEAIKEEEGLSIINILTQRSLKSLANDREFVCLLISINNSLIRRTVAQRMVN